MKKDILGLPLEYGELSEYFDAHNICDDTDAKNSVIEKLLRSYKVKTVLDLTCGTGSQVFYLAKCGYAVTGADLSPALLDMARKKAEFEKMNIPFIDGDMRILKVGAFDAVITIFNAIGHLKKSDFEKTMRNISTNLKVDGLYIFDIFNLEAMTDKVVSTLLIDDVHFVNDTQIYHTQYSRINRKNGRLTSYDSYKIQKNNEISKVLNHKFALQIYRAQELKEMLMRNGFRVVYHYGMDGSGFINKKTQNILTIAQK